MRDITEKKKTEEKLEIYRNQLEALVNRRTAELITRNEQLQEEINVRKQSNKTLETVSTQILFFFERSMFR